MVSPLGIKTERGSANPHTGNLGPDPGAPGGDAALLHFWAKSREQSHECAGGEEKS